MKNLIRLSLSLLVFCFIAFGGRSLAVDDSTFFPAENLESSGLIGTVGESSEKGESQMLLFYIPKLTNILLYLVSPLVAGMFIFAGVQFVYAGADEEQLNSSKTFFQYGIMGIVFILASFSLMAAVYQIIK